MKRYQDFHIHGDNIVECERTLNLIKTALADQIVSVSRPRGSPVCPVYQLHLRMIETPLQLTFYPGFGRWDDDIIQFVRERGGCLREAADVVITGVRSQSEEPLIAIEYCGALPAGNQAWQRNGRAYSFGLAHIPYLCIAELGGYELDASRNRKAPRMPNPAVPFSYLSCSLDLDIPVLPVFVTSPGADEASRSAHADHFADAELNSLMRAILLGEDRGNAIKLLRRKVLDLVKRMAKASRAGRSLTPEQWAKAYSNIERGRSLVEFLVEDAPLSWSKIAYISALTGTAKKLMQLTSTFAVGMTSTDLPMCVIPSAKRKDFASRVCSLYGDTPSDFSKWLGRTQHLAICWVMGFKPRGDDARPDRGLPPLTRMLIGKGYDLLSVVYGPAPPGTWAILRDDPITLAQRNGLWEAILAVSDGLLIDSVTDKVTSHGFTRAHWERNLPEPTARNILVTPNPKRVGENDVDTVLHTLLARYAGSEVYEGMCNPPGGDWSGISLQPPDRSVELRWLSLPRVSGTDTKRPDHVFQFFGLTSRPIIFSVESKETANAVENNIGPKLSTYVANLIASPASIERATPSQSWRHSDHRLNPKSFIFASGVAFIPSSESQIDDVAAKAGADVIMAYTFKDSGKSCEIRFIPGGTTGNIICDYASRLKLSGTGITIQFAK